MILTGDNMATKMGDYIKLSEDEILQQLQEWLIECDADELARLAGEIFGGKCYFVHSAIPDGNIYAFYPDVNNYFDAFDGFIKE